MTRAAIASLRLQNQHLIGETFSTPHEAVSWLGAVQSQDYFGASWSLGQRIKNATEETINKAFNDGKILRTHVMRPTWHFIAPEDIRWILRLTAPRVKTFMGHYNRKLELDDNLFAKTKAAIVKVLKEKQYATRQELRAELSAIGIKTDVQRLAHIVMWAELDAVICSGPRIGKQFTYALLEKRAPKAKEVNREESLAELATRYFQSHGPAQVQDFSWWSGLTIKDSQEAIALVKSKFSEEIIDGKTYWFIPNKKIEKLNSRAFLVSIYDEYTIAYKDRSALGDGRHLEKMIAMGNALTSVMIFAGEIVGTWKRVLKKNNVEIKLSPFEALNKTQENAFREEVERFGKFLGLPAKLT